MIVHKLICLFITITIQSNIIFSQDSIPTIKIGSQIWLSINLDVTQFQNGDSIPEAKTNEEWYNASKTGRAAWCIYENDSLQGKKFGKLYNWYALNDPRGIVPPGYRIPNEDDWITLENNISIKDEIGSKLKHEFGWFENGSGNNYSGFSALPGGFRSPAGIFYLAEKNAYWWNISEYDSNNSFYRFLSYSNNIIVKHHFNKGSGFSVRFIKE